MKSNFVPVSAEQHKRLRWRRVQDYAFSRELQSVDIALGESANLCMTCPILFRQAGNGYVPIALLGAEASQNAFLSPDFRWVGSYIPALLRAHPFRMMTTRQGKVELQVDSLEVDENSGELFFTEDGSPAPALGTIIQFLHHVEKGRRLAHIIADKLDGAGAIRPLMITGREQEPQAVPGLFTVEEPALKAIPDAKLAELRDIGALKFAYHQMLSLEMWPTLIKLSHRQRARREEVAHRAAAIYQPTGDGDLEIDWSQFNQAKS